MAISEWQRDQLTTAALFLAIGIVIGWRVATFWNGKEQAVQRTDCPREIAANYGPAPRE